MSDHPHLIRVHLIRGQNPNPGLLDRSRVPQDQPVAAAHGIRRFSEGVAGLQRFHGIRIAGKVNSADEALGIIHHGNESVRAAVVRECAEGLEILAPINIGNHDPFVSGPVQFGVHHDPGEAAIAIGKRMDL